MKYNLLLVEDDIHLGYILKEYIELNGYNVVWAKDGKEGLDVANSKTFHLIILDITMPKLNGFEVANSLKQKVPIIFLTAKSLLVDKLKGFKLGADDYLVKPVEEEELIARIEVVLRRRFPSQTSPNVEHIFRIGGYLFDSKNQRLEIHNQEILLTSKEAELLKMLCQRQEEILDRKETLTQLWGTADYFNRRNMDVFISRIRKHLSLDDSIKIVNIHGKGFMLKIEHNKATGA